MQDILRLRPSHFILLTLVTHSSAIWCYQCGTESFFVDFQDSGSSPKLPEDLENTLLTVESCPNQEFSFSSWGTYVQCASGEICVKTIIDYGADEKGRHHYGTGSRGCATPSTAQGQKHHMSCGILKSKVVDPPSEIEDKMNIVCFCNQDFCNGGQKSGVSLPLIIGLSFIFLCFLYTNLLVN